MPLPSNKKRFLVNIPKRTSQKLPAAATVEAVCIFPFVFVFFISIVWMMDIFFIHSRVGAAVNSAGNDMVAYSYPYYLFLDRDYFGDNDSSSYIAETMKIGWSEALVRKKVNSLPEASRISGLSLVMSDFTKEEDIDIVVTYYVKPYISIPGIRGIYLTNHFYSKAYIGYSGKDVSTEKTVYITEHGTVYHTHLGCQALKVSPESVDYSKISNERNESGAKYYSCNDCSFAGFSDVVYITPYGTRFHARKDCGHLRIEIFEVPISQVSGREQCKFCKKKE